jgi:hypothetical protein
VVIVSDRSTYHLKLTLALILRAWLLRFYLKRTQKTIG